MVLIFWKASVAVRWLTETFFHNEMVLHIVNSDCFYGVGVEVEFLF